MKKKIISFVLAMIMIFSLTVTPASAASVEFSFSGVIENAVAFLVENLVKALVFPIKEGENFVDEKDYKPDDFCGNLYDGTDEFISEAQMGSKWHLGSSEQSLVPENWEEYEDLYLGGYMLIDNFFSNDVREILDDMKVRVVAMNDGSERGTAVFATIDSIGLGNADVVAIREKLYDYARANNINSVNIFTTHTHSGIDTQGLWTDILGTWPASFVKGYTGAGEYLGGTSDEYMDFLYEKTESAIKAAVSSMKPGTMTYAEKDFSDKYVNNKNRPSATAIDGKIRRFIFTPEDSSARPTMILNMAAHPSDVGLATDSDPTKGHGVSGDYVYYIGQTVNGAGYDFMFFNGAICGIYIDRVDVKAPLRVDIGKNYGTEIGAIALGLTMTEEEIRNNEYLKSVEFTEEEKETYYVPWYKDWEPAAEQEVEPVLNIRLKKVEIQATNPVIILAAKLQVVNYLVKKADKKYFITTEIGYMEMGDKLKVAFAPGELCTDIAYGGASLTAEGSARGKAFSEGAISELFGDDVLIFGMANDAIGYIVPDNDYLMCIGFGHYHETISLGKYAASSIMKGFKELKEEIG